MKFIRNADLPFFGGGNTSNEVITMDSSIESLSDEQFSLLMNGTGVTSSSTAPAVAPKVVTAGGGNQPGTNIPEAIPPTQTSDTEMPGIEEVEITDLFSNKRPAGSESGNKGSEDKSKLPKDPKTATTPDTTIKDAEEDPHTVTVLTSIATELVKRGVWQKYDLPENVTMTSEIYAQISAQQAEEAAQDAFEQLLERTGKYRSIVEHALNGGSADKIADLLLERNQIDISNLKVPTEQKEIIREYYSKVLTWEKADIDTMLNKFEADSELEKYAGIAKKKLQEFVDSKIEGTKIADDNAKKKAEYDQKQYVTSINQAIQSSTLSDSQKEALKVSILKPAFSLGDRQMSEYQAKLYQMTKDPVQFLELAQFVVNREAYIKRATAVTESDQNKSKFKINLGGTKTGTNGGEIRAVRSTETEPRELSFFVGRK
jgi:hypothetical protein